MAVRTYMRLIAILVLVGLMSGQVTARRGRAAGGTRASARGGAFRAGRSSASAGSFRGRSLRAAPRSAGSESFRGGAFGAGRRSTSARSLGGGSFRTRAYPGGRNSAESESHEDSSFRLSPNTRTYHIGRHIDSTARCRTTDHTSSARRGHYRYYGSNRRYRCGSYFYIGLPYLRYYGCGYPYYCGRPYYYYSVPYYQYYYPHPRYYYYEYYRTYDYPPRTYRQRRPRPPQDSRTGEPDKTASPQTQTEDAGEYVEADPRLEDIADAFAARDYENAARQANQALTDEPENAVLPFVYSQALFADGKYSQAADVLREAVRNLDAEKQELFYPLGFYPDEDILNDQITGLREAAAAQPSNADLQLLLGYQLLGVARYDDALDALHEAQADYVNKEAAAVMIEILERARSTSPDT